MIEPPPQSHSVKQTRSRASSIGDSKSIISLGFEESRQGVGLWDEPGLYGTYGFPLSLDNEPPATIASLLKKFFSSVKGDFAPTQLWDSLNAIIQQQEHNQESNQSPSSTLIQSIRKLLKSAFPSQNHLHTFAYYFLHLQRVSSFANVNFMTPRNLITCTFINGGEGAVFLLCYADLVFGNVDLVGRDVVAMLRSGVENEAGEDGHNGEDSILEDMGLGKESCFLDRWLTNHVHASYGDRKQSLGTSANRDCSQ
ncbi:hypothetical protein BDR26DRAFT_873646 [Obelidium mucronatum]|nr:hypothetical protein BDR26DRAFT_873646 [Obelidium mucronatum]